MTSSNITNKLDILKSSTFENHRILISSTCLPITGARQPFLQAGQNLGQKDLEGHSSEENNIMEP